MLLKPNNALAALQQAKEPFKTLFRHGSLEVEIYKPAKIDLQTPHTRDELYVIISGSGTFNHAGVKDVVAPGDVLFVPAGDEHKFEAFSDDFCTWVFFYGPEGGEQES